MSGPTEPRNPFSVRTPEDLTAAETASLFVDVFSDFFKIRDPGHSMLNGARGTGKSMMFRYLLPDCQKLERNCEVRDLDFLAVLVSVKNTYPNIVELQRLLDSHASVLLHEHFLTMYVASKLFDTLSANIGALGEEELAELCRYFEENFITRLARAGAVARPGPLEVAVDAPEVFRRMTACCDSLYNDVIAYLKRLSFPRSSAVYEGALCGYLDFLVPLVRDLQQLSCMPKKPIYLLIDDGDHLNPTQTRIVNSWITTRTSSTISIKVSTAFAYKSLETLSSQRLQSPHDYSEVNISDLYTSSKGKYLSRVEEIVRKRLGAHCIDVEPRKFFPEDTEQEEAIRQIGSKLRDSWAEEGRGFRPGDDVLRYARPLFIASLKGPRKAGSTYSYAGFEQLVHVSSGIVRFFLESAALMFNEEIARGSSPVQFIRAGIQNEVLRQQSTALMFDELDKMFREAGGLETSRPPSSSEEAKIKLHNLLKLLGGIFHLKLVSSDAERRVFSIAFSDQPDAELRELFDQGVRFGYFQKSTIGNKDGTGRTALFVLTRRLAPYFFLDPTGFAGYLFVTSARIREGLADPERFLRAAEAGGTDQAFEVRQLRLFD